MDRVVVLVDMDCFYAQVEQRGKPELWGKPVGVLQYSANGQSGLIAVSYESRAFGVKRGMTANQAKELCPQIEICLVPQGEFADKADVQKYRDASAEVFACLVAFDPRVVVERASVDEAYLDLTEYVNDELDWDRDRLVDRLGLETLPTSHVVDGEKRERRLGKEQEYREEDRKETQEPKSQEDDEEREKRREQEREQERRTAIETFLKICETDDDYLKVGIAAEFTERIREELRKKTQFHCSAGIGNNKMIAKLVCAAHKPRQQSFVPPGKAATLMASTRIQAIRGLGGKLGQRVVETLNVETMGELSSLPPSTLQSAFPDHAEWFMRLTRGEDDEVVKARLNAGSIGVGKNFPGKLAISTVDEARKWLHALVLELGKRLADDRIKNRRSAQNIVVHVTTDVSMSRTVRVSGEIMEERLFGRLWPTFLTLRKSGTPEGEWNPPIVNISLCAGKFIDGVPSKAETIMGWVEKAYKEAMEKSEREDKGEFDEEEDEGEVEEEDDDVICLDDDDDQPSTSTGRRGGGRRRGEMVMVDGSEFQLDDEGWQVWPQRLQESGRGAGPSTSGRGGTRERGRTVQGRGRGETTKRGAKRPTTTNNSVCREIFNQLPPDIQAEVLHLEQVRKAKELKEKTREEEKAKGIQRGSSKRRGSSKKKEEPPKKRTPAISTFFAKKG